jgi:hypothetical protein
MSAKRKQGLSVTVSEPQKEAVRAAAVSDGAGADAQDHTVHLSWEGVKAVQKKIERCLELYMTQARAVLAAFFCSGVVVAVAVRKLRHCLLPDARSTVQVVLLRSVWLLSP